MLGPHVTQTIIIAEPSWWNNIGPTAHKPRILKFKHPKRLELGMCRAWPVSTIIHMLPKSLIWALLSSLDYIYYEHMQEPTWRKEHMEQEHSSHFPSRECWSPFLYELWRFWFLNCFFLVLRTTCGKKGPTLSILLC